MKTACRSLGRLSGAGLNNRSLVIDEDAAIYCGRSYIIDQNPGKVVDEDTDDVIDEDAVVDLFVGIGARLLGLRPFRTVEIINKYARIRKRRTER
jgi:hypothetical protein